MTTIKRVERKIRKVEGFDVIFRGPDGHDMKGNKKGLPSYTYPRAAKESWTVEEWKAKRFRLVYSGYEVDVLNDGFRIAPGNTKLRTVRATYQDD